jgi:hypothetical protein
MFAVFHHPYLLRYFIVGKEDRLGKVNPFQIARCTVYLMACFKIWKGTLYVINIFEVSPLMICHYWKPDVPSRSNDYSHNDCKSSLKAILLNKVVVGKGCKLLQDNTTLTAPPTGYDSVGKLNNRDFDLT